MEIGLNMIRGHVVSEKARLIWDRSMRSGRIGGSVELPN